MAPNISNIYIYIYQIEDLEEMSWYVPFDSDDDQGERNDH